MMKGVRKMFDKFGEFDSAEEINKAAAAQLAEGDIEAVRAIAEENGIDKFDAEDYIAGDIKELTTPYMACLGKIDVEKQELKLGGILLDWADEITVLAELDDELAAAVRKRDKRLAAYIALLAENGLKNAAEVDKSIVELAPEVKKACNGHPLKIGVPDKKTRKKLIEEYYLDREV